MSACAPGDAHQGQKDAAPFGIALTGRVVDAANILPANVEQDLTAELAQLEQSTTDQVVVVTVPQLKGHAIEDVALGLGRGWRLGRADVDNGVMLVVAPNERKVRIEVGYGLEGLLTDDRAGKIVRLMLPEFRDGDLPAGIMIGVREIDAQLRSNTKRPQYLNEARRKAAA
nr:TPM domain-containing protein [Sphingomonas telluris]